MTSTPRTRKLTAVMLLCGLACGSQSAFSATTTLDYLGSAYGGYQAGNIFADKNGDSVNDAVSGNGSVSAGGFLMKDTATNKNLAAWCVDVFHWLDPNPFVYTNGNASMLNHSSDLQKLVNQRFSQVTDKNSSTAFQLAVWEIVTETGGGGYSLSNGNFKATGFGNALALASTWLALDGQNTGSYKIAYFYDGIVDNKYTQNLISVSPVPLPGAALLMLSALGLGGLLRRRSNKDKAGV